MAEIADLTVVLNDGTAIDDHAFTYRYIASYHSTGQNHASSTWLTRKIPIGVRNKRPYRQPTVACFTLQSRASSIVTDSNQNVLML
ncbi:hypothetical protein ACM25N_08830 [Roseovarius sp. C7]|uniref:hypothetical protein n=1 Tax=Roseovarius sp. C7 TaxID=3398643 RepID=UPI0039F6A533